MVSTMLRILTTLLLVVSMAMPLQAVAKEKAKSTKEFVASKDSARAFVDELGNKALEIIKQGGAGKVDTRKKLESLFEDSVDIEWVSKFVLGKYWRQASDAQKSLYKEKYKYFLITHYTSKFSDYSDESFKIHDVKEQQSGEYQLTMEIVRPREPSVYVDYRIRAKEKGFAIFDIIVEGVSLITTQRSEFGSVISRKGLDYLIEQLDVKTKEVTSATKKS